MKKLMCILLCLVLMGGSAEAIVEIDGNVIRVAGPGTWGSANTRTVATMVKVATEAAPAWYAVKFGWQGIAVMAACVVGQYIFEKAVDAAYSAWITPLMSENNYRIEGGVIKKKTGTGYEPVPGSSFEQGLNSHKSAHPQSPGGSYTIYYDSVSAQAAYNTHHTSMDNYIRSEPSTGCPDTHGGAKVWGWYGPQTSPYYKYWAAPSTAGQGVQTVDVWENRTVAQMQSDLSAAIADGTVTDAEKKAWEAIEKLIEDEKSGNKATGILNAKDTSNKSLDERLKEKTQEALDGNAQQSTDLNPVMQSLINAISSLYTLINNGFNNLKSWLGVDDVVSDQTNTGIDPAENETVINSTQVDEEKEIAKTVTTGLLDNLLESTKGLADRIEVKVRSMVSVGSGVCSLSFSVFGGSQSLDFCSIDFSTLRGCVLFVGTVAAALIIVL